MAKKKTTTTPKGQEERPKPVHRTPIIVAIIGVVGAIIVALINLFPNLLVVNKPSFANSTQETSLSTSVIDTTAPLQNNDGACFGGYFAYVPSQNQADLQAGISKRIPTSGESAYGIRLFINGSLLGGALFTTGAPGTNFFNITTVVDENCSPVIGFGNLDYPSLERTIGNWENLGISFSEGNYRIRMGWYGSEIELLFAANP